jgi:hypothetical protein
VIRQTRKINNMKNAKRKHKTTPLSDQQLDAILQKARTPPIPAAYQKQFPRRTMKQIAQITKKTDIQK